MQTFMMLYMFLSADFRGLNTMMICTTIVQNKEKMKSHFIQGPLTLSHRLDVANVTFLPSARADKT